jgi:Na+-driven multidrug efflux pump
LILSHAACAIAIWPLAFTLPNAFRAASDVKFSMKISVFSMWVFRVALSYVFAKESLSLFGFTIPGFGMSVLGVWVAMYVDWVFRAILFVIRFVSGKWLTKYKAMTKNA